MNDQINIQWWLTESLRVIISNSVKCNCSNESGSNLLLNGNPICNRQFDFTSSTVASIGKSDGCDLYELFASAVYQSMKTENW